MAVDIIIGGDASKLNKELTVLTGNLKTVQAEAEKVGDASVKSFKEVETAVQRTDKSLLEMRNEFKALDKVLMTSTNLTAKQVKEIQTKMGQLRNETTDTRKKMMSMGEDAIPVLVNGLRGVVAMAQGVTSTLSIFGVQSEKLEKSMMALINASMALNTAWDLYEESTLKTTASLIKDTAVKITNTIVTKVSTTATQGATVAQKALNLAMMASPYLLVAAGVAALITTMIALSDAVKEAEIRYNVWATRSRQLIVDLTKSTKAYLDIVTEYNKSVQDFNDRNLTDGEKAKKQYLVQAEQQKLILKGMITQLQYKDNLIKAEIAQGEAQYEWMQWLLPDQAAIMRKGLDDMAARHKEISTAVRENIVNYANWEKTIKTNAETIKENLNTIQEANKKDKDGTVQRIADYEKLLTIKVKVLEADKLSLDFIEEKAKIDKEAADQQATLSQTTALKRLESEKNYTKSALDELNDLWAKGEIGWTEYEDRINKIEAEAWKKKLDNIKTYVDQASQLVNGLGEIVSNLRQTETNELNEKTEEQTAKVEDQYEAMIEAAGNNAYKRKQADDWYSKQKKDIEEKTGAEALAIQKKYEKAQQAIAISQAIISGAQGIVNIWAQPFAAVPGAGQIWAGLMTALIAGVTATQVGLISSQKFAKGGTDVLNGPSHSNGGIAFGQGKEAEGGERWAIFSRAATQKNTGLADFINAINSNRLTLDKDLMSNMMNNKGGGVVVVANFNGGEHLEGMHDIMKRQSRYGIAPDGRIIRGINRRKLLN